MSHFDKKAPLRFTLAAHPDWKAYRQSCNLDISRCSVSDLEGHVLQLWCGDIDPAFVVDLARKHFDAGQSWKTPLSDFLTDIVKNASWRTGTDTTTADTTQTRTSQTQTAQKKPEPAPEPTKTQEQAAHSAQELAKPSVEGASPEAIQQHLVGLMQALQAGNTQPVDEAAVERIVDAKIKERGTLRIELKHSADSFETFDAASEHQMFGTLLQVLSARGANGLSPNVWLCGPTGSGKTHSAEKAAQKLQLKFYMHGAMSMAHELIGFVDAGGTYHETQFVKAFRDGGVCLLDELDAAANEALLALNAALANGHMPLPNGELVDRHPDFKCIGAANTFGTGATAEFVGRSRIDAAFLSRFPVKLSWDYDLALEIAISGNAAFAKRVQKARDKAQKNGLKIIIDPRHSQAGAALIAAGMTEDKAAELTYLSGLTDDQKRMIEG